MEFSRLRHFVAVADAGSITTAAALLGIAQPALSQSISRLEADLDVRLFVRSRRGVALTPAGCAVLEEVRGNLARLDSACELATEIGKGLAGRLTVGFVASASYEALPRTLAACKRQYPNMEIILRELPNGDQVRALEHGEIDIGMLFAPVSIRGRMRQCEISRDHFIAVVPDSYPVGADKKVSMRDLMRTGMVFPTAEQLPGTYAEICTAIRSLGEEVRIVQEANRTMTILACVAGGCGVSLLPSSTRRLTFAGVQYCEIRERDALPDLTLLAVWPARSKASLADRFAQLLADARAK